MAGPDIDLSSFTDLMTCILGVLVLIILLTGIDASQISVLVATPKEITGDDKSPVFFECRNQQLFYISTDDLKDAVDATLALAANPSANGIFNVGSGTASTWIELVTPIFHALGLPVEIRFVEMPEVLRGKYQYHTLADISRIRKAGWQGPRFPLASAVTDYVANYLVPGRHLGDHPESES